MAWQIKNTIAWWAVLVTALWDDTDVTWDSLTIFWDAVGVNWKTKNKGTWYTTN
jgi:hypothetical protein